MSELSPSLSRLNELLSTEASTYRLAAANGSRWSLNLELYVFADEDAPGQVWHVRLDRVWQQQLTFDQMRRFAVRSEHPRLWIYVYLAMDLWFHSKPERAGETIGCLYQMHQEKVGKELPFETFFNSMPLPKLFAGSYGLLASGPEPLVQAYQQVLDEQKIANAALLHPVRRRSNLPEDKPLYILLMEQSYVIFEECEVSTEQA